MEVTIVDKNGNELLLAQAGAIRVCPEEHHTAHSAEYTADGSGNISVAIVAPPAGKRIGVHVHSIHTDAEAGSISLDFATSGQIVGKLYSTKTNNISSDQDHTQGDVGEPLTLTSASIGSGKKVFVKVQYIIEPAEGVA